MQFEKITEEMHEKCPVAWSDTYGGHWVAAGSNAVFELARCPHISNDHDINGERKGLQGDLDSDQPTGGDPRRHAGDGRPEHRIYRNVLNPYLSPAAVARWEPFVHEIVRASIDEKIESGRIDFIDDLANVVPAVLTMALLGIPLKMWTVYCEPTHAAIYTPSTPRRRAGGPAASRDGYRPHHPAQRREAEPRPGLLNALINLRIDGEPAPDMEILGMLGLIIGGGFDTTTALTAHALEWLSEHPDQRAAQPRTRHPAGPGHRGVPAVLHPGTRGRPHLLRRCRPRGPSLQRGRAGVDLLGDGQPRPVGVPRSERGDPGPKGQSALQLRHRRAPLHRLQRRPCGVQDMLTSVLDRIPDYRCDPERTVHYDTIGVIQGMRHLPATFTPVSRWARAWTRPWTSCSGSATSRSWRGRSPSVRSGRHRLNPAALIKNPRTKVRVTVCLVSESTPRGLLPRGRPSTC